MKYQWSRANVFNLAWKIEAIARKHGAHIGLTGGLLYTSDQRKDVDFIVYRHQVPQDDPAYIEEVQVEQFIDALQAIDIHLYKPMHRVFKCTWGDPSLGRFIDFIFADRTGDISDDSNNPPDDEELPI